MFNEGMDIVQLTHGDFHTTHFQVF